MARSRPINDAVTERARLSVFIHKTLRERVAGAAEDYDVSQTIMVEALLDFGLARGLNTSIADDAVFLDSFLEPARERAEKRAVQAGKTNAAKRWEKK